MKKLNKGLNWDNCEGVLAQKAERMGWALCIGAGSSRGLTTGVFPDWPALVKLLIKQDKEVSSPEALHSCLESFRPDALIEAAKNRLNLTDDEFRQPLKIHF